MNACEIMCNSLCVKYLDVTYTLKKIKKLQLFENLNDVYIIWMPTFVTCK